MLLADHNAASVCLSVSLSLFEAVNHTNTGTVSKATLGKFWETGWSAWLWAFPNALIPSSTALIGTKLAEVFTYYNLTRTHFAFNNYAHILCLFTDKVWEWGWCVCVGRGGGMTQDWLLAFWNKIQTHKCFKRTLILIEQYCIVPLKLVFLLTVCVLGTLVDWA